MQDELKKFRESGLGCNGIIHVKLIERLIFQGWLNQLDSFEQAVSDVS